MIWCVDDDNTIRDIEVYTLTQTGFEAKGFADGISMLEALKTEKPELIVLDIMLPGKDGVEVLKEIRSNPETRKIPVIMATAKGVPEAIENTAKIADKCNFDFEFGVTKLPNYDVPEEFKTHEEYFRKLTWDGIEKRYGKDYSDTVKQRAEYELGIIERMGYVDYYLIVWDYINYAKSIGIPVGPGRGSGAADHNHRGRSPHGKG